MIPERTQDTNKTWPQSGVAVFWPSINPVRGFAKWSDTHEQQERDGAERRVDGGKDRDEHEHGQRIRKEGAVMGIPKGAKVWLPNRRDGQGRYFHRGPDGRRWYGTPAEVRDAALMPWRRKMLADGLRFIRSYAERHETSREELAEWAKSKRRDAIQFGRTDAHDGVSVTIPAAMYIELFAGSRLVRGDGESFGDYIAVVFQGVVDSLLDVAERVTGKREIPLTRHERAALSRLARHG